MLDACCKAKKKTESTLLPALGHEKVPPLARKNASTIDKRAVPSKG